MKIEDFEDILYEKEENGICTITINRPERRNAVSYVSFLEIYTVLEDMEKDNSAKVLLITGNPEGNAFSSGGYFEPKFFEKMQKEIRAEIDLMDVAQMKLSNLILYKSLGIINQKNCNKCSWNSITHLIT